MDKFHQTGLPEDCPVFYVKVCQVHGCILYCVIMEDKVQNRPSKLRYLVGDR